MKSQRLFLNASITRSFSSKTNLDEEPSFLNVSDEFNYEVLSSIIQMYRQHSKLFSSQYKENEYEQRTNMYEK